MFLAQYWGKKDISGFQKVLGINITSAAIVGTLMAVFVGLAPSLVLKLFNADASVMAYGIDYLRYLVPSYILMGLTFPLNFALRSMNKVKVTMTSTIISVIVNICVNYVLIFGKLGFAPMGVKGAAIGTVVTRLVEFIVLAVYFGLSDNPILKKIGNLFKYNMQYVKSYFSRAVTLIGNEMMWSLGTTIYFIIYGHTGTDALAAMSIMQTLQMLSKILIGGFCGSSAIIIGNEIGRGDVARVERYCSRFHRVALVVGALSAVLVFALIKPIQTLYSIEGTVVGGYVRQCMYVLCAYIFLNANNSINVEGIFRSGGDVKFITLMDMGSIWLVGMPVTFLLGIVLKLDIVYVYSAYIVLELYKLPLGYFRFRTGKWLNHLHNIEEKKAPALANV